MSDKQCREGPREEAPRAEKPPATIKPAKKVGEAPGNLRRRETWYQRRSGGSRGKAT